MLKTTWPLCLMLPLLSACEMTGPNPDYCQYAHPIYLDREDVLTLDTQKEVLEHNSTGYVLCNWKKV